MSPTQEEDLPPYAIGTLDWTKIEYWCSDIDCPCGISDHFCIDNQGSARFFRCSGCRQVFAFENTVRLLIDEITSPCSSSFNPHSFALVDQHKGYIQWKGSRPTISVACLCGNQFTVSGDFLYEVDCSHCHTHYFTDWFIGLRKATESEIAVAMVIHDCAESSEE